MDETEERVLQVLRKYENVFTCIVVVTLDVVIRALTIAFNAKIPSVLIMNNLGITTAHKIGKIPFDSFVEDSFRKEEYMNGIAKLSSEKKVGVLWRNGFRWYQPYRNIALRDMNNLNSDVLFSLDPLTNEDELNKTDDLNIHCFKSRLKPRNLDNVLSLMQALDGIVSIDKVFANIAGILNKKKQLFSYPGLWIIAGHRAKRNPYFILIH